MVFDLEGKVALITGGSSGIGLQYAKELLRNGVKGVTLANINQKMGKIALDQIANEFGQNKAIFVKTDVTDIKQFEDAFKKTIETFKNVDILINNAGVLNDAVWEKEIAVNVNGTIHGVLLGMDNYLSKYKQGPEAVILNTSSVLGICSAGFLPIYSATKHAICGLTRSWGSPDHYERSKVRVIAVCPGLTNTSLISDISGRNLGAPYEHILNRVLGKTEPQEPEFLGLQVVKLIQNSKNGTIWVVECGHPAYQYIQPDRSTMKR